MAAYHRVPGTANHGKVTQIGARSRHSVGRPAGERYPVMREHNDIKITITAVVKTSRSANKRRICDLPTQSCSARNGTSTSARSSRRAHFRSHPSSRSAADEILMVGVRWRQVTPEHVGIDEALLTRPISRRLCDSTCTMVSLSRAFSASSSSRKVIESQSWTP